MVERQVEPRLEIVALLELGETGGFHATITARHFHFLCRQRVETVDGDLLHEVYT